MVSSNLRLSGLATGMDTESIVQNMMKLARMPLDKKVREKQALQWKQDDYRSINLSILSMRNKAFDMRLEGTYQAKKVISGNENVVTATATASSAAGTYSIKVGQLATAASNASADAISTGNLDTSQSILSQAAKFTNAGTFFDGKTTADTFSVTVNGQDHTFSYGDSLDSIIRTLNADKTAQVSFFYDEGTDKIALNSTVTGAAAALDLSGDFFTNVLRISEPKVDGKDAIFELNGLETSRSSNNFTINGTSFSLKGLTSGGLGGVATTVEVQNDTDTIYNNIKAFVDLYNETLDKINGELKEERFRKYKPLTDAEKEAMSEKDIEKWEAKARSGLLSNDSLLSRTVSEMRTIMVSTVSGLTGAKTLADIGITTGNYWENSNGKLKINESALKKAIADDPEGVAKLFNNNSEISSEKGLSRRLYDKLDAAFKQITTEAGSASALYDQSSIGKKISRLDKDMDALESRMIKLEERYWRQYTAMEKAIQSMNQQSSWLTSQLEGLSQK